MFILNCQNTTLGPLPDGSYNVTVYANDTANNTNSSTVYFTIATPSPPDGNGDGGKKRMYLSHSFVCPGDEVLFNSTKSGANPLSGVAVRILYDNPPYFYLVDVITSDGDGLSDIMLSQNGTYVAIAQKKGYKSVETIFDYETCYACEDDDECGGGEACDQGQCVSVDCDCGIIEDHQCIAYECCANGDCPEGQSCINNIQMMTAKTQSTVISQ